MEVLCANEGKAHKINAIKIPKQLFYDALDGITGNSNNDLRCNFHTESIFILHAYDLAVDATGKHNAGTVMSVWTSPSSLRLLRIFLAEIAYRMSPITPIMTASVTQVQRITSQLIIV